MPGKLLVQRPHSAAKTPPDVIPTLQGHLTFVFGRVFFGNPSGN